MNTLQRLVFPNLDMPVPEEMYLRLDEGAWPDLNGAQVYFETGSILSSDTFYNGFSVGTWKRRCDVRSLAVRFEGVGEFVVTIGLHRVGQASVWLAEHRLSMLECCVATVAVPEWTALQDGMLFLRIRALGPAVLQAADFETSDAPLNPVRLGLVITHFNRQAQVLPAVRRIREQLLERPALRDRITLTVVDNSRNLPLEPHPLIRHLPNRNLGGTGGFVRGLLALIDDRRHTHALFMDDDASCETESIARSLAMLQYAHDPRLSIAGALLRDIAPWELVEKGARFDGVVRPLHAGLDMRRVVDLLEAERPLEEPDYGAWWFFAFPLAEVREFPFPFFVRGDDIWFGLRNRFRIATLNGVACLGEDFSSKHGPMTAYLDARYHLVHALIAPGGAGGGVFWVGDRLFRKALNGYLYTSARAVTLALRHVLEGPDFFRANLDLQAVRALIGSWMPAEKLMPMDRAALAPRPPRRKHESWPRRWLRGLSLQGFLLPSALIRDRLTVQPKDFHGRASAIFRYRSVLYEHAPTGAGFVAEFDRGRFFRELFEFLGVWARLFARLPKLRRDYARGAAELGSVGFWREVYRDEAPGGPARSAAGALKVQSE